MLMAFFIEQLLANFFDLLTYIRKSHGIFLYFFFEGNIQFLYYILIDSS